MRRSNLATLMYLLVVFASGAVVGGFATRLYLAKTVSAQPTHAELNRQYIQDMRGRLHLSEDQVAQLKQIMSATDQRMHDMHKTIKEQHIQQVVAILDDTQKADYAKLREEREAKRRQQEQNKK